MGKVKAHELRGQSRTELLSKVDSLRKELAELQVAKVSGQGGASKLSKINVVRKAIARVLTVANQTQRTALRKVYRKRKYKPLDLRVKKTRAIRRRLTVKQLSKKTIKQTKKEQNFPQRKYALRA